MGHQYLDIQQTDWEVVFLVMLRTMHIAVCFMQEGECGKSEGIEAQGSKALCKQRKLLTVSHGHYRPQYHSDTPFLCIGCRLRSLECCYVTNESLGSLFYTVGVDMAMRGGAVTFACNEDERNRGIVDALCDCN